MNKKVLLGFGVIFLLASFSLAEAGCFLGFIGKDCRDVVGRNIIPNKGGTNPDEVIANSCDADNICEVNNKLSSPNSLMLSSQTGAVKVEGDLTLTKIGYANGVLFVTNDAGSLTITPQSGSAKIEGSLTVTSNIGMNNLNVNGWSDLEDDVRIGQELTVESLEGSGNAYVCVNYLGKMYRSLESCV